LIAVLLIDIVSNNEKELFSGIEKIQRILEPYDKTGFSVANNEREADRFWQDRKSLGAIAAHTNAFKLNEDIVLPINSLARFASWVDQCNIEEKKINQISIIDNIIAYLNTAVPLADPELLQKRVGQAKDLAYGIKKKMDIASRDALEAFIHSKNFYTATLENLRGYTLVREIVTQIYETTRSRLIVIATHMHAGDGNVHVNIPVLSNDREMMKRANAVADRVMEKAVELDGVVSGEHGIGITKIKHLDQDILEEFCAYRKKIDPEGLMNPNKLSDPDIIHKVFTPSYNLLEIEARILNHSSLAELAMKVSGCVRCGKCKIQCPAFYPKQNLFFHPRNKNLAIGSLIEALLYISQRTQSTGYEILKNIEQIADHCTICHKCLTKCPVNIDSGAITIAERNMLEDKGFKHGTIATKATLAYLSTHQRILNPILRSALLTFGSKAQKTCTTLFSLVNKTGPFNRVDMLQMLKTPVGKPHSSTLRRYLPRTNKNQAILIEPESAATKTVAAILFGLMPKSKPATRLCLKI
jgi:ferredoxin